MFKHDLENDTTRSLTEEKKIIWKWHAFEYLGSTSIAFDASCIALPYSSSLLWAKARFAQYTAFWLFSSIASVYRSIACEYLWAVKDKDGCLYKFIHCRERSNNYYFGNHIPWTRSKYHTSKIGVYLKITTLAYVHPTIEETITHKRDTTIFTKENKSKTKLKSRHKIKQKK